MQGNKSTGDWQKWNLGADSPRWSESLRDGTPVAVRPLVDGDADAERAFIESLSEESKRFRFLGQIGHPSEEMIRRLTHVDSVRDVAFAATAQVDGHESLIGVSRYGASSDGGECEFAVTVRDDWQRRGVGTLLLAHLLQLAKSRGIKRVWSIDSASNTHMDELARYFGFERRADPDDATQVIHSLWID
ncbi:MAG: GNAT family N-acetyltransferase [Arenimonas sp.]